MRASLLVASGMLALAAVVSAKAADLPSPAKALLPAAVYNWTGFYIGGNFGGGWGRTDVVGSASAFFPTIPFTAASTFAGGQNTGGILGGGHIGYNYQFLTNWVAGVEADIDGANITGSANTCATLTTGGVAGCQTNNSVLKDFGTARGRVGYVWNNVFLYGTGGLAWGENSVAHTATCVGASCPGTSAPFTSTTPSTTSAFAGWTAGAGAEWAFLPNWTFRVEYLHLQFDNVGTTYIFSGTTGIFPFRTTSRAELNIGVDAVRVGFNFIFK
jgi:outer membrane immunogenic protein